MLSHSGHLNSTVFWPQLKIWHLKGHTLKVNSLNLGKWVIVFVMIRPGFDVWLTAECDTLSTCVCASHLHPSNLPDDLIWEQLSIILRWEIWLRRFWRVKLQSLSNSLPQYIQCRICFHYLGHCLLNQWLATWVPISIGTVQNTNQKTRSILQIPYYNSFLMTCGSQPQDYGPKYTTAAVITIWQQHSLIQEKLKK